MIYYTRGSTYALINKIKRLVAVVVEAVHRSGTAHGSQGRTDLLLVVSPPGILVNASTRAAATVQVVSGVGGLVLHD